MSYCIDYIRDVESVDYAVVDTIDWHYISRYQKLSEEEKELIEEKLIKQIIV